MNKKAMEVPGWFYVVALVIGVFVLLFVLWLFTRSGRGIVETLRSFG